MNFQSDQNENQANEEPSAEVNPDLGAVILCGGKSTRLGLDKTQLRFRDNTFLEQVVSRVSSVCSHVVLVGDTDFSKHKLPDVLFASDQQKDAGPLEGIRVGLKTLAPLTKHAFVTSCDVPLLNPELIQFLFEKIGTANAIVPFQGERIFGMTAIYKTELHSKVATRIQQGLLRVSDLSGAFSAIRVEADELRQVDPELDSMTNVNSAEDYFRLLERFCLDCSEEIREKLSR